MLDKNFLLAPLGLAGMSIGFSQLGNAFGSDALTSAGETTSKFIAPSVTLSMGGLIIHQLRDMSKKNGSLL